MSPVSWSGMHRPGYWEPREVPAGFRKQVEEFAGQQDAIGISHLLSGTNDQSESATRHPCSRD